MKKCPGRCGRLIATVHKVCATCERKLPYSQRSRLATATDAEVLAWVATWVTTSAPGGGGGNCSPVSESYSTTTHDAGSSPSSDPGSSCF